MKKIVVIDGQGGKLGRLIIEQLRLAASGGSGASGTSSVSGTSGTSSASGASGASGTSGDGYRIMAIGTNSIATATMLKAGADYGATGENPVVVNCRDADIVVGPIGIIAANALYGEVTEAMAVAVGSCKGQKVLLPVSRCRIDVMGVSSANTTELVNLAVGRVRQLAGDS